MLRIHSMFLREAWLITCRNPLLMNTKMGCVSRFFELTQFNICEFLLVPLLYRSLHFFIFISTLEIILKFRQHPFCNCKPPPPLRGGVDSRDKIAKKTTFKKHEFMERNKGNILQVSTQSGTLILSISKCTCHISRRNKSCVTTCTIFLCTCYRAKHEGGVVHLTK